MKLLDSKIKGSIITFTFEGGQTLKAENYGNGNKIWYLNGKYHREDGPAIERADGTKYWFLNGKELTEAEFNKKLKKPCNNKVIEIDGIKYRLTIVGD